MFYGGPVQTERGFVLISVMLALTLLAVVATEFAFSMRLEASMVRSYRDSVLAAHLAEGGVQQAIREVLSGAQLAALDERVDEQRHAGEADEEGDEHLGGQATLLVVLLELAAVVGLPDNLMQVHAVPGQMGADAFGQQGGVALGQFVGITHEGQPTDDFAHGVLEAGQA